MTNQPILTDKTDLFLRWQKELYSGRFGDSVNIKDVLTKAEKGLAPFFEHPACLPENLRIGSLWYEYAFLQHHCNTSWIADAIQTMLAEFRSARNKDPDACFKCWGTWMETADRAIHNTAMVAHLEVSKENLSPELSVKSCFRDIGDMLEGSLQPFALLRLNMRAVAGNLAKNAPLVASMTFGQVIAELVTVEGMSNLYRPLSLGLSVNQWRNIANHNSYHVNGSEVICTYGVRGKPSSLRVPIPIILNLTQYVSDLVFTHKIAFEFFSIDNLQQIIDYAPKLRITEHTINGTLVFGLVAAGFTIKKVGQTSGILLALALIDNHGRTERATKTALQEAIVPYVLLSGTVEIVAIVQSGNTGSLVSCVAGYRL